MTLGLMDVRRCDGSTTPRLAEDLRTPYTLQGAISLERQLPWRTALSVSFITARTLHVLRSRDANAPLPGTFTPVCRVLLPRTDPSPYSAGKGASMVHTHVNQDARGCRPIRASGS